MARQQNPITTALMDPRKDGEVRNLYFEAHQAILEIERLAQYTDFYHKLKVQTNRLRLYFLKK